MSVRPEFIVKLQGREFVLFAGLLDAATAAGLTSISTDVVQIPAPDNGNLAVVQATVLFGDGRSFQGTGDASPESVGRMILPHLLRMAETRSIGRALRWALNVSVTMREELGEDNDHAEAPRTRQERPTAPPAHRPAPKAGAPDPAFIAASQAEQADRREASGDAVCSWEGCGQILSADEILGSRRHFGQRLLCSLHGKEAKKQQQEARADPESG